MRGAMAAGLLFMIPERNAHPFDVYASDCGFVCIKVCSGFSGAHEDSIVCIHPDQIPLLNKWIREVVAEIALQDEPEEPNA